MPSITMKKTISIYLVLILILSTNCTSNHFSRLAKYNQFDESQEYLLYKNDSAKVASSTFGDFKFSKNQQEIKNLKTEKIPFKNILLYAKTYHPPYEYYILLNDNTDKTKYKDQYLIKDTLINGNKITLAASKTISKYDWEFISENLKTNE